MIDLWKKINLKPQSINQFMKKDEWYEYVNDRFMKKDKSKAIEYKSIHEKRWKWQVDKR